MLQRLRNNLPSWTSITSWSLSLPMSILERNWVSKKTQIMYHTIVGSIGTIHRCNQVRTALGVSIGSRLDLPTFQTCSARARLTLTLTLRTATRYIGPTIILMASIQPTKLTLVMAITTSKISRLYSPIQIFLTPMEQFISMSLFRAAPEHVT